MGTRLQNKGRGGDQKRRNNQKRRSHLIRKVSGHDAGKQCTDRDKRTDDARPVGGVRRAVDNFHHHRHIWNFKVTHKPQKDEQDEHQPHPDRKGGQRRTAVMPDFLNIRRSRGFLRLEIILCEQYENAGDEIHDAAGDKSKFIAVIMHNDPADHIAEHCSAPDRGAERSERKPLFIFRRVFHDQSLCGGSRPRTGGGKKAQGNQHPCACDVSHEREYESRHKGSAEQHRTHAETVRQRAPDRTEHRITEHTEKIEHGHINAALSLGNDSKLVLQKKRDERHHRRKPGKNQQL